MRHHEKHIVEVVEESEERILMKVSTLEGVLLGNFSIAKEPWRSSEETAQATYEVVYGKVGA